MLLIIAITIAIISGLTNIYVDRLDKVSIWLSRAMSINFTNSEEEKFSEKLAFQIRLAIRTGDSWWINTFETLVPGLGIAGVVIGFFYAWWGGILAYIISQLIMWVTEKIKLYPNQLNHYLLFYDKRLTVRYANYIRDGDTVRAQAIKETQEDLEEILKIYIQFELPIEVPDLKTCKNCPLGDKFYLGDIYFNNS